MLRSSLCTGSMVLAHWAQQRVAFSFGGLQTNGFWWANSVFPFRGFQVEMVHLFHLKTQGIGELALAECVLER